VSRTIAQRESDNQYMFFRILQIIVIFGVWVYYNSLLLKATDQDITTVFINYAMIHTGMMCGYLIGSFVFSKMGYLNSYRFSIAIRVIALMLGYVTLGNIAQTYPLITLIFGLGNGWFWVNINNYSQSQLRGQMRSRMLSVVTGLELLLEVVCTLIIGYLVAQNGYSILFIFGSAVWFIGLLYPWKYNLKPREKLGWSDISRIIHRTGFKRWAFVILIDSITGNLREIVFLILPFLFIDDDFGVGIFYAIVGTAAAVFALLHRNDDVKRKVKIGYVGAFIIAAANFILLAFWGLPALLIRSLIQRAGYSMYVPINADLELRNGELFLGDFLQESTNELVVIRELMLFVGRVASQVLVLGLIFVVGVPTVPLLMFLVLLTSFREVIMLTAQLWLRRVLKR
jgi:hypothetical protein